MADWDLQKDVYLPPSGRGPGVMIASSCDRRTLIKRAQALAEEGYVVRRVIASTDPKSFSDAFVELSNHPACTGKLAVIANGAACQSAVEYVRRGQISALILYDPEMAESHLYDLTCPTIIHHTADRYLPKIQLGTEVYAYKNVHPGFSDSDSPTWETYTAGIAFSRDLALLRRELGPRYDLSALWDHHLACEFEFKDATANMKTMVSEPYVNHVPTMIGGVGHDLLKRFYTHHFIGQTPTDRRTIMVSRTVGSNRLVEEKILCFTHNIEIDWLLPGIKPTGKYVEIPIVVIVQFQGDKLCNEHIYWDQAGVLAQIGLLDPKGKPIAGIEQAHKLRDKTLPSNTLMARWTASENYSV
jgi:carboxymethylenebutenolidase